MGRYCGWVAGLSLAALALGLTIWMELGFYRDGGQVDLAPLVAVPSSVEVVVRVDEAGERDRWLNEIVSRPLFNPDRRPAGNQDRGGAGLPRLTAIIVAGSRRIAMFEAQAGGRATVVEIGGRIGAYEVRDIADGGMTVAGPEGTVVVRPTFDGAPPVAQRDAVAPDVLRNTVQPEVPRNTLQPVAHRAIPAHPAVFNVTAR